MMIALRPRTLCLLALVIAGTACSGGSGDGAMQTEAIECCMLRELASNCSSNPNSSLLAATQEWRQVGNSGNDDACIRMVSDETLGCSSSTFRYDESDAIVDCS